MTDRERGKPHTRVLVLFSSEVSPLFLVVGEYSGQHAN